MRVLILTTRDENKVLCTQQSSQRGLSFSPRRAISFRAVICARDSLIISHLHANVGGNFIFARRSVTFIAERRKAAAGSLNAHSAQLAKQLGINGPWSEFK
jgi:hypothetical protein